MFVLLGQDPETLKYISHGNFPTREAASKEALTVGAVKILNVSRKAVTSAAAKRYTLVDGTVLVGVSS